MEEKYDAHPYVTKDGYICYEYLPYCCPESKKWAVLEQALCITIPKFYHTVMDSDQSSKALKNSVESLYTNFITGYGSQLFTNYQDMDWVPPPRVFKNLVEKIIYNINICLKL